MPAGFVKFFDEAKGFGFIAPDDGGADIFVHVSEVVKAGLADIQEGDFLEFDVERNPKTNRFACTNLDLVSRGSQT